MPTITKMSPEELLNLNKFNIDEHEPHIIVDSTLCKTCETRPCLTICSAVCYRLLDGEVQFDYAGCLECGTCRVVCHAMGNKGVVKWEYPRATFGVSFRFG